ncbi:caspase family protein [Streptomyces albus]|uniref:caspase family protein n=1 Tax=Streptomyces sp. NRRL F-5917 TaxID=1463873 RepID=UPI000AF7B9FB|nr:caspase family protein [Streptomyces sp. NRRL F-5917]
MLPDPGASKTVLIGTSTYEFLEDLPAVSNNLSSLAEVLSGPTSWSLDQDNCTVLSNPVSAVAVMDAVRSAGATARDTLLVYYAGHGLVTPEGELYLGLPQSRQQRVETGIPYDWLRRALLEGRAERVVVILDCCYGGLALGTMGPSELAAQADVEGTYLLAAASETRQALAPPGETHTAFTGELLAILSTGIAGGPEKLDLDSVFRQLRKTLSAKARPVPQGRERNSNGQLALGWNPAFSRTPVARGTDRSRTELRSWPDPAAIRTVEGFFSALRQVRVVSGLTHAAVSHRSGGQISVGTVSKLLNRKDLPRAWKTTGTYLTACGMPEELLNDWHQAWERLRSAAAEAEATELAEKRDPAHDTRTSSGWGRAFRRLARRRLRG